MDYNPQNPLIVQSDFSLLLEVHHPHFTTVRDGLNFFAELEKSPEHIHIYRITPLSLWNAAATGHTAEEVLQFLTRYAKYPLPENVRRDITTYMGRYGLIKLLAHPPTISAAGKTTHTAPGDVLYLYSHDLPTLTAIAHHKEAKHLFTGRLNEHTLIVPAGKRGIVKQVLLRLGYPLEDLAGYIAGEPLAINLRTRTRNGQPFSLRDYQRQAVEIFYAQGRETGGSGVIVLPCGAGKTIVGLGIMAAVAEHTLILTTSTSAAHQWINELLDKTDLPATDIGEYSSSKKELRPVTVTTYQMVTYRAENTDTFPHFAIFNSRPWGLIIYDEVHTLPAPVFQITAELQAKRRLGLTATLVREDGREGDVFTLIGPKKFDIPWSEMEQAGWIAPAICHEIRVPMDYSLRMECAQAPEKIAYRLEAENPAKFTVVQDLLARHAGEQILIIGQYLNQLKTIADRLGAPLITGKTPTAKRDELYAGFRRGAIPVLVVSKVANFAIDLPNASVAIQVSGAFGSRQEEAQRLGRILRPKADGRPAHFYSIVSKDAREQEFAHHRQLFLAEQGYTYEIIDYTAEEAKPHAGKNGTVKP